MLQFAQQCVSGLQRHLLAGGIGLGLGFLLGLGAPSLGVFISVGPLLMVLLCLVPCLAPLLLLRRRNGGPGTPTPGIPPAAVSPERGDLPR